MDPRYGRYEGVDDYLKKVSGGAVESLNSTRSWKTR